MPEASEVERDQRLESEKWLSWGPYKSSPPGALAGGSPCEGFFRACADSQRLKESEECLVLLCLCESVLVAWLRCMLHQCILRSICGPNVFLAGLDLLRGP